MKATGITSVYLFCISLFHPILAPYVKSLGFNDLQLGIVFAIFPAVLIFAAPILGSISDHIGRKQVIIFGIGCQIMGIVLYMFDTYRPVIFFARLFESVAYAAVIYSGLAMMEDQLKDKVRGKFSGVALTILQIGQLLAPVIGGLLADQYLKLPFVIAMVVLLISFIMLTFRSNNHRHRKISKDDFRIWKKWKQFLKDRRLKGMAILGFVMHASIPLTFVFFPLFIIENFGLSFKYVGYATFAYTFFHLLQFLFGSIADRVGQWRGILFGTVMTGLGFIALHFADTYWTFMAVLVFAGLGTAVWNVTATSFLSQIGEATKIEGSVLGEYVSFAKMGDLLSYIASGAIAYYLGIQTLMTVIGVAIILFSGAAYFYIRPQK
ncbi:TPA: MFS transporter [Candidatus Woesearchaeota archaeon]|nr:MFS transporter [Candidatus Woesearchaeota archaeon]